MAFLCYAYQWSDGSPAAVPTELISNLQIQPELRRCLQRHRKLDSHRRRDAALFGAYLIDHADLHVQMPGEPGLRDIVFVEKLLEIVAGMKGGF